MPLCFTMGGCLLWARLREHRPTAFSPSNVKKNNNPQQNPKADGQSDCSLFLPELLYHISADFLYSILLEYFFSRILVFIISPLLPPRGISYISACRNHSGIRQQEHLSLAMLPHSGRDHTSGVGNYPTSLSKNN